jgi:hypothetical protein
VRTIDALVQFNGPQDDRQSGQKAAERSGKRFFHHSWKWRKILGYGRTVSYSATGRMAEAKEPEQALLGFLPGYSLSRYRLLHMFKNPEDTERMIAALRKAGLPE